MKLHFDITSRIKPKKVEKVTTNVLAAFFDIPFQSDVKNFHIALLIGNTFCNLGEKPEYKGMRFSVVKKNEECEILIYLDDSHIEVLEDALNHLYTLEDCFELNIIKKHYEIHNFSPLFYSQESNCGKG